MKIVVGSNNLVKLKATELAITKFYPEESLEIIGIAVDYQVSNQPLGLEEILKGAKNRAIQARKKFLGNQSNIETKLDFSVGIEAGFVEIPFNEYRYLDFQFCVIIDSNGNLSVGSGSGLPFPSSVINQLLNNREQELGDIMADISGNQKIKFEEGAIGYYSKGKINRTEITKQAVEMALIPFTSEIYQEIGF